MEYTKDMILNVHYGEVNCKVNNLKKRWTSKALEKLKKHRLAISTIAIVAIFISIDVILIMNFFHILTML